MEGTEFNFVLHAQLPTVNHVVSTIMELAPGGSPIERRETKLRKAVRIHKLIEIWCKAFTMKHVTCRRTIKDKIHKELERDYNNVVTAKKNKRVCQMEWRKMSFILFNIKKVDSDPETFDEMEKTFYYDQLGDRKMYLSEEIDAEYQAKEEEAVQKHITKETQLEEEMSFIFDDDDDDGCAVNEMNTSADPMDNIRLNRSGLARVTNLGIDAFTQTNDVLDIDHPKIRNVRNCDEEIKSTRALKSLSNVVYLFKKHWLKFK